MRERGGVLSGGVSSCPFGLGLTGWSVVFLEFSFEPTIMSVPGTRTVVVIEDQLGRSYLGWTVVWFSFLYIQVVASRFSRTPQMDGQLTRLLHIAKRRVAFHRHSS